MEACFRKSSMCQNALILFTLRTCLDAGGFFFGVLYNLDDIVLTSHLEAEPKPAVSQSDYVARVRTRGLGRGHDTQCTHPCLIDCYPTPERCGALTRLRATMMASSSRLYSQAAFRRTNSGCASSPAVLVIAVRAEDSQSNGTGRQAEVKHEST